MSRGIAALSGVIAVAQLVLWGVTGERPSDLYIAVAVVGLACWSFERALGDER